GCDPASPRRATIAIADFHLVGPSPTDLGGKLVSGCRANKDPAQELLGSAVEHEPDAVPRMRLPRNLHVANPVTNPRYVRRRSRPGVPHHRRVRTWLEQQLRIRLRDITKQQPIR